jgi:hypothetical protein
VSFFALSSIKVFNFRNKGCDDGDGEPEFSDDEAERQYLQKKKAKQRTPADSLSGRVLTDLLIFLFSASV